MRAMTAADVAPILLPSTGRRGWQVEQSGMDRDLSEAVEEARRLLIRRIRNQPTSKAIQGASFIPYAMASLVISLPLFVIAEGVFGLSQPFLPAILVAAGLVAVFATRMEAKKGIELADEVAQSAPSVVADQYCRTFNPLSNQRLWDAMNSLRNPNQNWGSF